MSLSRQKFVLCLLLSAVASCAPPTEADLLHLRSVGPVVLDSGSSLEVEGESLPLNRTGELTLRGKFYAPGRPPVDVDLSLSARVVSISLARAMPTAHTAPTLLRRGTFVGEAQLSFDASPGGGRVTGHVSGVRLDVRGGGSTGLQARNTAEAASASFADSLGLRLEAREDGDGGLSIAAVRPASSADRAGLVRGDFITRLGPVGLARLADFRVPPETRAAVVELEHDGVRRSVSFELDTRPQDPLRRAAMAFALFLACLSLALSPAGRLVHPSSGLRMPRPRLRHGLVALAGLFALVAFAQLLRALDIDLLLWVALLACWGLALSHARGLSLRPALLGLTRRLLTVELAFFAVVGASLLSAGASTLADLIVRRAAEDVGGAMAWTSWPLVTDPLSALGAFGFLMALLLGSQLDSPGWSRNVGSVLYRCAGSALFLVVFGNGAALLSSHTHSVFVAEAGVVCALLTLAAPLAEAMRRLLLPVAAATLALSLSPASFRADLPHGRELALSLLVGCVLFAFALVLRFRRRPAPRWLVHPFL